MSEFHIGIDVGGTNIAIGAVAPNGALLLKRSIKTPHGDIAIVNAIVDGVNALLADTPLAGNAPATVGIGIPGTIYPRGVVSYACNINMRNVPLEKLINERLKLPVFLENDANCAALGEYICGCGANKASLLAITLGTGIGGGYVENGRLLRGNNSCGAELGHMVIVHNGRECACSRRGCFEAYASTSALIGTVHDYIRENPGSICAKIAAERGFVDGNTVFDAIDSGDKGAVRVFDEYVGYLACGITNLINIFQPEIVCLGGGIIARGERILAPIRDIIERENYARDCPLKPRLLAATLGNDAGIIGAALLHTAIQ